MIVRKSVYSGRARRCLVMRRGAEKTEKEEIDGRRRMLCATVCMCVCAGRVSHTNERGDTQKRMGAGERLIVDVSVCMLSGRGRRSEKNERGGREERERGC